MTIAPVLIRPVETRDAQDINVIRRNPRVAENLLALPSESIRKVEDFIIKCDANDHLYAAEISYEGQPRVIGMAGMHVKKMARESHRAEIGMMVHQDFWGQGVGSKLMENLIDLADNWLLLKRLELSVYPDNLPAIKLYEKFGFVKEGVFKYASVRRGKYADIVVMARYHAHCFL